MTGCDVGGTPNCPLNHGEIKATFKANTGPDGSEIQRSPVGTWRIIPVSKWLITMVRFRPLSRVVGPLPNGLFMAHK